MALEIKICGMQQPQNIDAVQKEVLPDYFGCIVYPPSPRHVLPDDLDAWIQAVHPKVKKVLVTVNADIVDIIDWADALRTSIVQLHGEERPELCDDLKENGFQVWKAIAISTPKDLKKTDLYVGHVDRFLFDTKTEQKGGSGMAFDWSLLHGYSHTIPYMLSGGLAPDMVNKILTFAIQHPLCVGIDLNSRFESGYGVKNPEVIQKFIREIRSET